MVQGRSSGWAQVSESLCHPKEMTVSAGAMRGHPRRVLPRSAGAAACPWLGRDSQDSIATEHYSVTKRK